MKLCECGCGEPAPLARQTDNKKGIVKGQPLRFIHGHHNKLQKPLELEESMWLEDKVTGCWVWQRRIYDDGYGRLAVRPAHRVSYELAKGAIPDGWDIDHLCRNRACVNPSHLEAVPRAINLRRGTKTKFTPKQIEDIRRLYKDAAYTRKQLAEMFDCHPSYITDVCQYKNWKDIEGFPNGT